MFMVHVEDLGCHESRDDSTPADRARHLGRLCDQCSGDEQALLELQLLSELDLADPGTHPVVAYEVSAVLRRYLEARYSFSAWKMTTVEVLRSMPADLSTQRAVPTAIQEVLEASDRVKFAGESVDSDVILGWIRKAKKVVEVTVLRQDEEDAA